MIIYLGQYQEILNLFGGCDMNYQKRNETALTNKILQYLDSLQHVASWKIHQSMYSGMIGFPDIVCCYKGLFVGIEVKDGDNQASKVQELQIRKIIKAGGVGVVVRSLEEVQSLVETLEKAKVHDEQTQL